MRWFRPSMRRGSRRGRWIRAGCLAPPLVGCGYLLLLAFPGVLFAHHVTRGAYRVASDEPIGPEIVAVLDEAEARLARSPLYDPAMVHRLSICNGSFRRWLLTPRGRGAFGTTYTLWLRGNTVLNRADIRANEVYREAPQHRRRPLSRVIAHERVHALMERRYGTLGCLRMPTWKKEGYCEYVAGCPSIDVETGKRLIREGKTADSGPSWYFRNYAMVKYLLDVEGLTIDEVVSRSFDESELIERVRGSLATLRL